MLALTGPYHFYQFDRQPCREGQSVVVEARVFPMTTGFLWETVPNAQDPAPALVQITAAQAVALLDNAH